MADETPNSSNFNLGARLGAKIRAYATKLKTVEAENADLKTRATTAETARTTAETELATLKAAKDVPTALKRVDELTAELRGIKHRAVFDKLASEAGVKPGAVDDLYRLSEYKADADTVDEAAVKSLIEAQKASRGFLFGEADEATEQPAPGTPAPDQQLPAGPGVNRGGSILKGPRQFTEAQLSDAEFCMKNHAAIAAASADKIERGLV